MSHASDVISQNLPAVEARWLPWVVLLGGDVSPMFHCAWIAIESGGNPCDTTSYGEAGIYQLMPGDNQAEAGVVPGQLACTDGAISLEGTITQVVSGTRYINACRAKADAWCSFTGVDYWRAVKMAHVAPAVLKAYGPSSSSWADFAERALATAPQRWLDNAAAVGSYGTPALVVGAAKLAALAGLAWLATRRRRAA